MEPDQLRMTEILIEDARWQQIRLEPLAEMAARGVLNHLGKDPGRHSISVLGCDDTRIAALNGEFRGKEAPTNVLSWPSAASPVELPGEERCELGDVALGYDTCAREAAAANLEMADHVTHLLIHGFLHLLGYDHETDDEAEEMEKIESLLLSKLGISDPYMREK